MDPIDAEMQLREWARENVIERMLLKAAAFQIRSRFRRVIAKALEEAKTEAGGKVGCGTRTTDGEFGTRPRRSTGSSGCSRACNPTLHPQSQRRSPNSTSGTKSGLSLLNSSMRRISSRTSMSSTMKQLRARESRRRMPRYEVAPHLVRLQIVIPTAPATVATSAGFLAVKWWRNSMPSCFAPGGSS